jgi:hypothetical protein
MLIQLKTRLWTCLAISALGLTAIGCSQSSDSQRFGKTGTVEGTLKFMGQPVRDARLQFTSKETGAAAMGSVIGGEFSIEDPVPAGTYKVIVLAPEEPAPQEGVAYKPPVNADIPWKYRDDFNSDLVASVKAGTDNHFEFEMTQ